MTQVTFTEHQASQKSKYARPEVGQVVETFMPETTTSRVVKSSVTETDYFPVKAKVTKVTDETFFAVVVESDYDHVGKEFKTKIVKSNVVRPGYKNGKSTCHWNVVA